MVEQSARRARTVQSIRAIIELEGSHSTAATRADQDDYVRGLITADELGDRVRRRYNVR